MRKLISLFSLLLFFASIAMGQQKLVTGKVTDKIGNPVNGATILIRGTTTGTSAKEDGTFSIMAKAGDVLEISGVNLEKISVTVKANSSSIGTVELQAVDDVMEEVVVTAGGILRKKREEGYNATRVSAQQITQAKAVNLGAALSGKVAGLQVNAINGGVNPNVRLVLRGNRSLLGNNTALVVVDNVIVPSEILGNLNPEDVEDINVLNGAGAAALYGSDASNGAIIVTTKRGKQGQSDVRFAHTTTVESVSFFPELQKEFGSGWQTGSFVSYENQQYGPKFDGSLRQLGRTDFRTGESQMLPYSPNNDRRNFWANGLQNQTDLSISSGDERGSYFISAQYFTVQGTTPGDEYNRASVRFNGSRNVSKTFKVAYATSYIQNRYEITTATATIFDNLLNTPAWAPLTKYKDWQNDFWSSPEGYYNDYYQNPYFYADNYRQKTRNDYLTGNLELSYNPFQWLNVVYRVGISTRNQDNKSWVGRYIYSDSRYITGSKANIPGSVSDGMFYSTQIISEVFATARKKIKDFSGELMVGQQLRNNQSKSVGVGVAGLVNPDLYNIGNTTAVRPSASEGNSTARQLGVYAKLKLGYKNWLYLDITGRNDWRSELDPEHWSFFYPAADVSFIASDAIGFIKNSKVIDVLKFRGGISKVGQVNIAPYALYSTFSQGAGFPYPIGPGFTMDNRMVNQGLKPEMTTSIEFGLDAELLDRRINAGITYYKSNTVDQTVSTGVSAATGFSSLLQNTGEVSVEGLETVLHYTPLRNRDWTITFGGNYTYTDNKVISISPDQERLALSSGGAAQVYAVPGQAFPVLMGNDYARDAQGRVIVDMITGYPQVDNTLRVLGNTVPKHRLGLDLEVKYKSWRLWVLAEHRSGYDIYHNGGSTMDFSGSSIRTVEFNRDRFVFPNSVYEDPNRPGTYIENKDVQVRDGGSGFWANGDGDYNMNVATNYIVKGDFWKIREVSLSYDVPRNLVSKVKFVKGATISLQGRNLFLWTPKSNIYTDPEYNFSDSNAIGVTTLSQSPPSRYYGATIAVTF